MLALLSLPDEYFSLWTLFAWQLIYVIIFWGGFCYFLDLIGRFDLVMLGSHQSQGVLGEQSF